jgi:hypothetical protein
MEPPSSSSHLPEMRQRISSVKQFIYLIYNIFSEHPASLAKPTAAFIAVSIKIGDKPFEIG